MATAQEILDAASLVQTTRAAAAVAQAAFDAADLVVAGLVATEQSAVTAARAALDTATAAAQVATGWEPVAVARLDALVALNVATQALLALTYDGQ